MSCYDEIRNIKSLWVSKRNKSNKNRPKIDLKLGLGVVMRVGWWGACSHVQGSRSLQVLVVERTLHIILI